MMRPLGLPRAAFVHAGCCPRPTVGPRTGLGRQRVRGVIAAALLGLLPAAQAGVIGRDLERTLSRRGTQADVAVIVRFAEPLDQEPLATTDRSARDNRLLLALKATAARHRAVLDPLLVQLGASTVRDLWIVNGVSATLPAAALKVLANDARVASIELDYFVEGGRSQRTPLPRDPASASAEVASAAEVAPASAAPAWNVAAVRAPELWAKGFTGRGVVVAIMDTGVDLAHPALRGKWRGGAGGWFDPHGEQASPYDSLGHGTQALGVILGGAGLGVAPDARWISVKLYNGSSRARMSDIHAAFQWLMDPDGDTATVDAPDIVNASWALVGPATGGCIREYADDVRALGNAGIALVFAAGNDGPAAGTSNSPGNNPGALSVGAVGRDRQVARQSSRGPSACDGGVYPSLVAPGVAVRTTDVSHGGPPAYTTVSGSSVAAPHVAGVLALLAGAVPSASVAELFAALRRGAHDLGTAGPDNDTGFGLVDALAALDTLQKGTMP